MRHFLSYIKIKALWVWVIEARFVFLTFGVIVVALVVALHPCIQEQVIRITFIDTQEGVIRLTGLILQLLGIYTIIWGINETRALFGHPSFMAKAKSLLGRFPLFKKDIVVGATGQSIGVAHGKMKAQATQGPGPNPTLETRVDAIEKNVTLIHERITSTEREMDEGFHKVTEALKSEEQARQTEDNFIRKKLEATGTGGLHISAIGASWLFVGVILSTAGIEIAKLLE